MIVVFGTRRIRKAMGPVYLRCGNCGMGPLGLLRVSSWFSLFLIPVIPVNLEHYAVCPNCKQLVQLDPLDLEEARAQEDAIKAGGQWTEHTQTVTDGKAIGPTCNMNGCMAAASKYLTIEQDGLSGTYFVCVAHRPDVRIGSTIRILGGDTIELASADEQDECSSRVLGIGSVDDMSTPRDLTSP
jgi:hypothetical protein